MKINKKSGGGGGVMRAGPVIRSNTLTTYYHVEIGVMSTNGNFIII